MKILVACEESQRVCIEFRKKGHEAYSCDTQECSGGHPEWHIKEDVLLMLDKYITFFTQNGDRHYISEWDMIIAFPPCTYMTKGGAVRMYKTKGVIDEYRYKKAMAAKEFFLKFYDFECPRIIIENPIPMKCIGLPRYSQIIQPYMFGEPYSKKTCLWIKGVDNLTPTNVVDNYHPFICGGGGRMEKPNYKGQKFASGSKNRSKTFEGIAKAMATQWG